MRIKSVVIILLSMSITSCGDYAALEAIEVNKKIADSLFRANKDTLTLGFKPICDSVYKVHYDIAVDSIKQLRIEGIQGLIDPDNTQ